MAENQVLFKGPRGGTTGTENAPLLRQQETMPDVNGRIPGIQEPTHSQIARSLSGHYWESADIETRFKIVSDLNKEKLYVDDATAKVMQEIFDDFQRILKDREGTIADDKMTRKAPLREHRASTHTSFEI